MTMFSLLGLLIFIALLIPHLGYASVIELSPESQSETAGIMNFSISFLNGSNATANYQVVTEEQGNMIIQSINAILSDEDFEPLEPLEDELEEDQQEEESSSSSSSGSESSDSSSNGEGDSGPGLGPGSGEGIEPGLNPIEGNGSDGEEVEEAEEEESSNNDADSSEE